MSTKYIPLDNTEPSPHGQDTTPPGYELDDFTPEMSEAGNSHGPMEPLDVTFHGDTGTQKLKLNYYPQRGISGIHKTIGNKLNSLGIQVDHELYSIGIWEVYQFRLLTCDEDRISEKLITIPVHYFRTEEEKSIMDAYNRSTRKALVLSASVFVGVIIFTVLFIVISSHNENKHGKGKNN
ncbi:hypothetical protein CLIB1423_09S03356 [[Candida] railenensis]|uniref:Uncharacterized protein n=1 Tax=[Candida] railenensis TaxID=45579 RepID=A0A9P0QR95_9ASCO|nr:hypothetical protein CLIB1423_09S03356 [[Candida] railenensis]